MGFWPPFVRTLASNFGDLLFPPLCAICECDLGEGGRRLCDECLSQLTPSATYRCPKCAARVAETFQDGDCPWCRTHELRFDRAVTLGPYSAALREAVLRTKRIGYEPVLAALFDLLWKERGADLEAARIDLVLPVPMHWRRRLRRGHNAPELLARLLGRKLNRPDRPQGLMRRRATPPQAGLSMPQRRDNVHNAFAVRRRTRVAGRRVLLVDDILTSGATCSELARILKRAGAATVVVAVLARAQRET